MSTGAAMLAYARAQAAGAARDFDVERFAAWERECRGIAEYLIGAGL